jgi:hypothetical protein
MKMFTVLVSIVVGSVASVVTQKPVAPTLASVMADAAGYLDVYEEKFGAVACEERTHEIAAIGSSGGRYVRSDVALIGSEAAGWLTFRDAFEVDGNPLRVRDTRLVDVLGGPPAAALEGARRINNEGARQHVGSQNVNRAINGPMLALLFLRRANQARSAFVFGGMKSVNGSQAALVTFTERSMPRVLKSADDAPVTGKLWIQPGTGRVVQTELSMKSIGGQPLVGSPVGVTVRIVVRYADQPELGIWVPIRLDEDYEIMPRGQSANSTPQTYSGRAEYSRFRRLAIDVRAIGR